MNTTYINPNIELNELQKICVACNRLVRGRTDKKFCDDNCRNNYNNRLKAESNNLIRNVNHALCKNRRILEGFYNPDVRLIKVSYSDLLHKGFHFKYFTHQFKNKKGRVYFFCYDFGYLSLQNGQFLLVSAKGQSQN